MATVYAVLGYIAATTTLILGQWLANPWFILLLILLFLYIAFSMFGFYEIYMPQFMTKGSRIKSNGSILYTFLFGAISGTAASPCLTPALAILLGYVAKRGNPLIGFATLFTFSFGMGLLLIIIGTFSNSITTLPRAGAWMNEIKKFFGFLLIGVSIYFTQPFVSSAIYSIMLYSIIAITIGYYTKVLLWKKK
jgi:thiol:disulfide interchange protein DsbD